MVDDEELRRRHGRPRSRHPATRAQIIENLIIEQYIHPRGADPHRQGLLADDLLSGLSVPN